MSISLEIAYAPSGAEQYLIAVNVEEGVTIEQVLLESGLIQRFPRLKLNRCKVGIFGKLRELTDSVKAGDRIEIYRRLLIDPKEARRLKARKKS